MQGLAEVVENRTKHELRSRNEENLAKALEKLFPKDVEKAIRKHLAPERASVIHILPD